LNEEIYRWALEEYLGLKTKRAVEIESGEAELGRFTGAYRRPFADIEVKMTGGRLAATITYKKGFPSEEVKPRPPVSLSPLGRCEEDRLLVLDGPQKGSCIDVIRKPDGSVGWLRLGRVYKRVE
jgi:hypothetical protein